MAFGKIPSKDEEQPVYRSSEKKKENKLVTILGAVLAIFLIVVAAFLFISMQQKPPVLPLQNLTNVTIPNISINDTILCDDDCLMGKAESTINYSVCLDIQNDSKEQSCLLKLSKISLEACVQLQNYTSKKNCVEWHAVSQKSTEVCNNLNVSDRKPCIENIDPCFYKILTDKDVCTARFNKNYSYCQKDEECLFEYAKLEKNATACEDIDSKVKKQVCLNIVENIDNCDDLLLASQIDYCRQLYAIRANKPLLCDAISLDTSASYDCYVFFATEEKNKQYCKKLSLNDEWKCYQEYSLAANDPTGCMEIHKYAPSARHKCLLDVANAFNNASVCESMDIASQKIECYYIAMGFNDEVYPLENCVSIKVDNWKDNCYSTLAKRTSNLTLCDYVLGEGMKKQCINAVTPQ